VQDAQKSKYWAVPEAKASGTAQAKIKECSQVRSCERLFIYIEPGQAPEPSRHLTPICALGGSFSNGTAKRLTPLCKRMGGLVRVLSGLPCSPLPAVNKQGSRVGWTCQRSSPPIELLFGFSRRCPLPKHLVIGKVATLEKSLAPLDTNSILHLGENVNEHSVNDL
jgi:hypothetical protein